MSDSSKIYLNREEQIFLMEFLELDDPVMAAEKFAMLMVEERADPTELKKYIIKIMRKLKQ